MHAAEQKFNSQKNCFSLKHRRCATTTQTINGIRNARCLTVSSEMVSFWFETEIKWSYRIIEQPHHTSTKSNSNFAMISKKLKLKLKMIYLNYYTYDKSL